MKARVYFILLLLIIPVQASLLNPLSLAGIKPDITLILLYIIGLLVGPLEAALIGIGTGLLLDIGSASFLGLTAFTRGLVGLSASLLGKKVLDISSPSNGIFLGAFSVAEGICLALFLQLSYGDLPFFLLLATRIIPQAIYTGVFGVMLLWLLTGKNILPVLQRRTAQKEL
jgi:rod shape-determining protein MreD